MKGAVATRAERVPRPTVSPKTPNHGPGDGLVVGKLVTVPIGVETLKMGSLRVDVDVSAHPSNYDKERGHMWMTLSGLIESQNVVSI